MGKLPTVAPELKDLPHVPVDCLEPFQGDLKTLSTREYNKLKKSILEKGLFVPFFVWKEENRLLDGHQRERVFLKEGWLMPVPVIYISAENEQDAKERLLLISSQYGKVTQDGWDEFTFDLNDTWIKETLNFDALPFVFEDWGTGGDGGESQDAEPQISRADELQEIWQVKPGQLWRLPSRVEGQEHRIICGDCMDSAVVERLMGGEFAKYGMHDPPYGIDVVVATAIGGDKPFSNGRIGFDNTVKTNTYSPVIGDDKPFDPSHLLPASEYKLLWGGNYFADKLEPKKGWIVWDKKGREDWRDNFSDCELAWTDLPIVTRIFRHTWMGMVQEGEREKRVHPTQKPAQLYQKIIGECFKDKDGIIIDFYAGSCPTIIAAENLSRQCRAVEISPAYCAVSLQRYQDAFGITPELITDEVTAVPAPAGAYNDDPHD